MNPWSWWNRFWIGRVLKPGLDDKYLNPSGNSRCPSKCRYYFAGAESTDALICQKQASGVGTAQQNAELGVACFPAYGCGRDTWWFLLFVSHVLCASLYHGFLCWLIAIYRYILQALSFSGSNQEQKSCLVFFSPTFSSKDMITCVNQAWTQELPNISDVATACAGLETLTSENPWQCGAEDRPNCVAGSNNNVGNWRLASAELGDLKGSLEILFQKCRELRDFTCLDRKPTWVRWKPPKKLERPGWSVSSKVAAGAPLMETPCLATVVLLHPTPATSRCPASTSAVCRRCPLNTPSGMKAISEGFVSGFWCLLGGATA